MDMELVFMQTCSAIYRPVCSEAGSLLSKQGGSLGAPIFSQHCETRSPAWSVTDSWWLSLSVSIQLHCPLTNRDKVNTLMFTLLWCQSVPAAPKQRTMMIQHTACQTVYVALLAGRWILRKRFISKTKCCYFLNSYYFRPNFQKKFTFHVQK